MVAAQFSDARYSGPDKFSDISGHWAGSTSTAAAAEGWIAGYPDGTYSPDRSITRAEVMALINEVLDRAPDADHMLDDMIHWRTTRRTPGTMKTCRRPPTATPTAGAAVWSGGSRSLTCVPMLTWSGTPCAAHDNPLIWLEPAPAAPFQRLRGPFPRKRPAAANLSQRRAFYSYSNFA